MLPSLSLPSRSLNRSSSCWSDPKTFRKIHCARLWNWKRSAMVIWQSSLSGVGKFPGVVIWQSSLSGVGKIPGMSNHWHLITCITAKLTGCKKQLILLNNLQSSLHCQKIHLTIISGEKCKVIGLSFFFFLRHRPAREICGLSSSYNSQFSTLPIFLLGHSGVCLIKKPSTRNSK